MAEQQTKTPIVGRLSKAFGAPDFVALERELREWMARMEQRINDIHEQLKGRGE